MINGSITNGQSQRLELFRHVPNINEKSYMRFSLVIRIPVSSFNSILALSFS
jgi:hypothetical protein